jgi:hypothetical protein
MQSQSRISKRQAKKQDTKDQQWQAQERFEGTQRQIRHGLPFKVPAERRIYLAESKFGPKHAPCQEKAAQQAVEDRPLATNAHNGTITYAAIPNLDYTANRDIPRYIAIRFHKCVSGDEAQRLLDQVKELKHVRSTANFFLPAY